MLPILLSLYFFPFFPFSLPLSTYLSLSLLYSLFYSFYSLLYSTLLPSLSYATPPSTPLPYIYTASQKQTNNDHNAAQSNAARSELLIGKERMKISLDNTEGTRIKALQNRYVHVFIHLYKYLYICIYV